MKAVPARRACAKQSIHPSTSWHVFLKEACDFVKRNGILAAAVVEIGVARAGDDEKLLVLRVLAVLHHVGVSVFAEIAGVSRVAVDDQDRGADLIGVLQDGLIDEALAADDVPAAVGVEGTGMIAALCL